MTQITKETIQSAGKYHICISSLFNHCVYDDNELVTHHATTRSQLDEMIESTLNAMKIQVPEKTYQTYVDIYNSIKETYKK